MSARAQSAERGSESLRTRRRSRRRRVLAALCVLFLLVVAGIIYELNQSVVRISHIQIYGADQSFADIATAAMQGKYLGLIPRDSTFFFPASRIRSDIIAAHPDVASVSIFRSGLDGLTVKVNDRVPISKWCGLAPTGEGVPEYCYVFDASGLVYTTFATSTKTLNNFTLYAPLEGEVLEPLRATIADADKLPAAFDFARQLGTLGSSVTQVVIHDGEVDDHLASGTRVTYVLGNEQNAYTALVSSRENFNLSDGSIDYVDLRFDGKVYVKRKE